MVLSNTYAKIDLDGILENYNTLTQKAGVPVMAVVKADAYGHGAVQVAKALGSVCGFFGVSSVAEAMELRKSGIHTPILLLGHTDPALFSYVVEADIRPAIFSIEDARALSREAVRRGKTAKFHFVVDTGMSRIGFQVTEESADACKAIGALPNLEPEGLFSHLATADEKDLSRTYEQIRLFKQFTQMLEQRGVTVKIRHLNNSAGILHLEDQYDMVRAGISLYGLYPDGDGSSAPVDLVPAMSWYSRVSYVKTLPAGRELSYGGTFTTQKDTVVATVSAGYADGYRRCLGNRFYVLIRGQKAPILGRVCMDQFMVDVSEIPGVQVGEPVVLLGTSGDMRISAEELAAAAGSFNYEQICDLSRRVTRIYLQKGKEVARVDYLTEDPE